MRYEIIEDFLKPEECSQIIEMAKTRLQPSYTWDVNTGTSIINEYRKSEQMFFNVGENPLVASIEQRIADLTGIPAANGEGLQVVRYLNGGYYKGHWDHFDTRYEGNKGVIDRGGQRIATVLMYLNNVYNDRINSENTVQGDPMTEEYPLGDTWFPRMGLSVRPNKIGKTIFWWNMKQNGIDTDETTYHCGRPAPPGCSKWIMTKWLRSGIFH